MRRRWRSTVRQEEEQLQQPAVKEGQAMKRYSQVLQGQEGRQGVQVHMLGGAAAGDVSRESFRRWGCLWLRNMLSYRCNRLLNHDSLSDVSV